MKKHVDIEHGALLKRYVEKINNYFKLSFQHELATKHLHFTPIAIFRFFFLYKPIYKRPWDPNCFLGRWKVICNKRFFCQWEQLNPFGYTEWLMPKVCFLSNKVFVEKVLPTLVQNILLTYVQLALATCLSTTCTFDLWMSIRAHDVFVVNFPLNSNLELKHVTVGLFKAIETNGATMVIKLWAFLTSFPSWKKKCIC
jgi:hypothetical protein